MRNGNLNCAQWDMQEGGRGGMKWQEVEPASDASTLESTLGEPASSCGEAPLLGSTKGLHRSGRPIPVSVSRKSQGMRHPIALLEICSGNCCTFACDNSDTEKACIPAFNAHGTIRRALTHVTKGLLLQGGLWGIWGGAVRWSWPTSMSPRTLRTSLLQR